MFGQLISLHLFCFLSFRIFVKCLNVISSNIFYAPTSFVFGTLIPHTLIHSVFSHRSESLAIFKTSFFSLFFRLEYLYLSSSLRILSSNIWNLLSRYFSEFFISVMVFFSSRVFIFLIMYISLLIFLICCHCHHTFLQLFKYDFLYFFKVIIIEALKSLSAKSNVWANSETISYSAFFPKYGQQFPFFVDIVFSSRKFNILISILKKLWFQFPYMLCYEFFNNLPK